MGAILLHRDINLSLYITFTSELETIILLIQIKKTKY